MPSRLLMAASVIVALLSAPAQADLVNMAWKNLAGQFTLNSSDPTKGVFEAEASNWFAGGTFGAVSRVGSESGTAHFVQGFVGQSAAFVQLTMQVSNIDLASGTAIGDGDLTVTDANGDSITAHISGIWTKSRWLSAFVGVLTDFSVDDASGDTSFDGAGPYPGPDYGSFSLDFPHGGVPFAGLFVDMSPFGAERFFDTSFVDADTEGDIQMVGAPVPGALALGAIGLLGVLRGRRHLG